jgi:hypothetical protein
MMPRGLSRHNGQLGKNQVRPKRSAYSIRGGKVACAAGCGDKRPVGAAEFVLSKQQTR